MTADAPRDRRSFFVLLAGNALSLAGSGISIVAIPAFVLESTGSALQTSLAGVMNGVPIVLAGIFGGVVVDRLGYKVSSVAADVLAAAALLAIVVLERGPGLAFGVFLGLVFARSLADTPGMNARESLLPELAEGAGVKLESANAWYETAPRLALLLGPIAGAGLAAAVGPVNALLVDAATFLVSALLIFAFVRDPASDREPAAAGASYFAELREGARLVYADALILTLLLTVLVTNFLDDPMPAVVLPVFAGDELGEVAYVGLLVGATGLGAVIGTMSYGTLSGRVGLSRRAIFIGAFAGVAACRIAFALSPGLGLSLLVLFLAGLSSGPLNPLLNTVLQERIPPGKRGRVFGVVTALAFAAAPFGVLAAGLAIEYLGLHTTLAIIAALYALAVMAMAVNPVLRVMEPQPPATIAPLEGARRTA